MSPLSFEDKCLVEKECKGCVKFRGDYCFVLSEFWCLARTSESCFAKTTSLFAWKRTLLEILKYNEMPHFPESPAWVIKELKRVDEKMNFEIDQSLYEDEHKPMKRGKSESGRDKSYKRKSGKIYYPKGEFPDFNR